MSVCVNLETVEPHRLTAVADPADTETTIVRYEALSPQDQRNLINFLRSL
jgi:hypothetical protein